VSARRSTVLLFVRIFGVSRLSQAEAVHPLKALRQSRHVSTSFHSPQTRHDQPVGLQSIDDGGVGFGGSDVALNGGVIAVVLVVVLLVVAAKF